MNDDVDLECLGSYRVIPDAGPGFLVGFECPECAAQVLVEYGPDGTARLTAHDAPTP